MSHAHAPLTHGFRHDPQQWASTATGLEAALAAFSP